MSEASRVARGSYNTNLGSVTTGMRRRLWLGLVIFAIIVAGALVYTLFQPKRYDAAARVLVEPRPQLVMPGQQSLGELPQKDPAVVDTEVEILHSPSLAEQVVKALNLTRDPEFGTGQLSTTAARLQRAVTSERAGSTYLIDIVVKARDPERAARIANQYATSYIDFQRASRRAATVQTGRLLEERVNRMAEELRLADTAVQNFVVQNNLMTSNGATLTEQNAAGIDAELSRALAEEAEARGRLASLAGSGGTLDSANAQLSLGTLRAQQAEARQALADASEKFGAAHPNYRAALGKVQEIDRAIAAEVQRARAAVSAARTTEINKARAEAAAASQRRASLMASAGATRGALARNTQAEVALKDLQRKADGVRTTYLAYLTRLQENQSSLGSETADSRIVALATAPTNPSEPNLGMNLALAVLLGLAAGFSAVTFAALLDPRLNTRGEVEAAFDIDSLPSIATLDSLDKPAARNGTRPVDYVIDAPLSPFAEQFRNLRVAAMSSGSGSGARKVIAITSSIGTEGKTTTSLCLATVAAMGGTRTILLDCDVRHRAASLHASTTPRAGLFEVLAGRAVLSDAVVVDSRSGLHQLLLSGAPTGSQDYFGSPEMARLLDQLRNSYDLIVLDTAPVLPIADTRVLAPLTDTVVLLARWQHTQRKAVEASLTILSQSGANIAGVALSMVDVRKMARQGYTDATTYNNTYKSYFAT